MGGDMSFGEMLQAPGRERPDFTLFSFPAASVVDGASEETEIDQALSLVGRRGRDFLGMSGMDGIFAALFEEHITLGTADFAQNFSFRLSTRTGSFNVNDPEQIWVWSIGETYALTATATGLEPLHINNLGGNEGLGEPFLYVAPRLFWRFGNDGDQTIAIDEFSVRWGSINVRLSFFTFIEWLERFADVQLL